MSQVTQEKRFLVTAEHSCAVRPDEAPRGPGRALGVGSRCNCAQWHSRLAGRRAAPWQKHRMWGCLDLHSSVSSAPFCPSDLG